MPDHRNNTYDPAAGTGAPGRGGRSVVGYGMGKGAAPQHAQAAPVPSQDLGAYGQQAFPAGPAYQQPVPQASAYQQPAHYQAAAAYAPAKQFVQPQTSRPIVTDKKRRPVSFWIAIIVVFLCLALAGYLAFTMVGGKSNRQGDLGQLDGKTAAEIQAELDRVVEEGMFNISIASVVEFPSGTEPGELRIENVPGNHYLMQVTITDDATGQTLYQTDLIEPNHHIQSDRLAVDLAAGSYNATAVFSAFDAETEEPVGQAAAQIQIHVAS